MQMEMKDASRTFLNRCTALNLAPGTVDWYGRILN